MAILTGGRTNIGVKKATVWSTAVAAGAGDRMVVDSFSPDRNTTELSINPIGAGVEMMQSAAVGAMNPTISFSGPDQYSGPANYFEALLLGGASVTAEASGSYTHSFMYNAARPARYATIGWNSDSSTALEMPTCLPTDITFNIDSPPSYVKKSYTVIGDDIITGVANTATTLLTTTLQSQKFVVARKQDYFYINAQAGAALSSSDKLAIKSASWKWSRPLEPIAEISGATTAANSLPRSSGTPPFECDLTVVLRGCTDQTYLTAHTNGTEYKAEIGITGDLIAGSIYYKQRFMFPRLVLIKYPDIKITSTGENEMTLTFKGLVTTGAVPSGMIDVYPHVVYTNQQSGAMLA